jgi:phosphate-selective porin
MRPLRTSTRAAHALLALTLLAGGAAAQDARPAADWTKKLTFASPDGRFTLSLGNRVQARYEHQSFDLDGSDDVDRFRARRVKTAMEGVAFGDVKYKIQANWVGNPILEDAYVQYARYPLAQLWVGRGKAFFGRQELTSSGKQQFVDRSLMAGRFFPGRDHGVALVGEAPSRVFEYQVGVYNGAGLTNDNDNDSFMTTARVVWHPFGQIALEESALDYPESPKLSLGLMALQNEAQTGTGAALVVNDDTRLGAEIAFKLRGLNAVAEYVTEERDRTAGTAPAARLDTDGWYAQLGYLFPNRKLEIAGRHSVISPDTAADTDTTETRLGVSWYMAKHDYKVQADVGTVEDLSRPASDRNRAYDEARLQLQIAF